MLRYRKAQGLGAPAENVYRGDLPNRPAPRLNVDTRRIPRLMANHSQHFFSIRLFRQNINILCWIDQIQLKFYYTFLEILI